MASAPHHSVKFGVKTYGLDAISKVLQLPRDRKMKAVFAADKRNIEYLREKSPVRTGQYKQSWETYGHIIQGESEHEFVVDSRVRNLAHRMIPIKNPNGPAKQAGYGPAKQAGYGPANQAGSINYYAGYVVAPEFRDSRGYPHSRDIPRAKIAATKAFSEAISKEIGVNLAELKKTARKKDPNLR